MYKQTTNRVGTGNRGFARHGARDGQNAYFFSRPNRQSNFQNNRPRPFGKSRKRGGEKIDVARFINKSDGIRENKPVEIEQFYLTE